MHKVVGIILFVLTVFLAGLKLTGCVEWPWWLVAAPLCPIVVYCVYGAVMIVLFLKSIAGR